MNALDQILETLGVEDFNRLVRSYSETKSKGRLRHWQDLMLQRASVPGTNLNEFETFLTLFANAKPATCKLSKQEFLADPVRALYGDYVIEPDWIIDAWNTSIAFVDAVSYDIARSVSKTGEFNLAIDSVNCIKQKLTPEQYRDLYIYIREESDRSEFEWRDEFCRLFPDAIPFLPPPEDIA